jgi:hypothetical protein
LALAELFSVSAIMSGVAVYAAWRSSNYMLSLPSMRLIVDIFAL